MELRHLRYFVAVGEDQHYGRASRRLGVAQPALSRQIQDLEKEIGFKLFDRMPRGVKLSAAGELFLEDARRILQAVTEATASPASVRVSKKPTTVVGGPGGSGRRRSVTSVTTPSVPSEPTMRPRRS